MKSLKEKDYFSDQVKNAASMPEGEERSKAYLPLLSPYESVSTPASYK